MRRYTLCAVVLLAALLVSLPAPAQDVMTTAIGGGPNGIPAIDANIYSPYGVAVDGSGNLYIAAYYQNRIFEVNTSGTISVVAGNGAQGYSGDAISKGAVNATLYRPYAVAVDTAKNVYIADEYNCVVRKVDSTGTITTIAGVAGQCNSTGSNLSYPAGLAVDSFGNLFIADQYNCVVRKFVLATKAMSIYAGKLASCGYAGDSAAATSAQMYYPAGLAVDSAGNLFIGDTQNYVIREVTKSTGVIKTVAGNHSSGYSGDSAAATSAQMTSAYGLSVNSAGTVVTFADYSNQRIRQFTVGGNINTVAGNGTGCTGTCGETGSATVAELYYPVGVAQSGTTYYFANTDNYAVDTFTVGGNLNRVAGNHIYNLETVTNGVPANGVVLNYPFGIATDSTGNVYVADSHDFMVRESTSAGLVNFFAGDGTAGFTGDGAAATSAELNQNFGVAKDSAGNVYIADTYNCLIRKVNTSGVISTFAGDVVSFNPRCGYTGDGSLATSAELYYPYGVAVDGKGNVYIADSQNSVVRKVTGTTITTIAGIGGEAGYSGDGGPATSAQINYPQALAVDPAGNVFIAEYNGCRVREVNAASGTITTVAGNGTCTFTGDGVAVQNGLEDPQGIAVDANDNLFIADLSSRVRWVSPNGIMTTIAGTGYSGYTGDGALATSLDLSEPTGVALDSTGNILVADYNNFRVRKITAFPAVSTNTSSLAFGLTAVGQTSAPQTITVSAFGPVTISNISTSANYTEADDCPAAMANGTTCVIYVYFVPTGSGPQTGTVTINSNGFFNALNTVNLNGSGAAISVTGAPLNFGNALVKTVTAAQSVTVKNNGSTSITMGTITLNETTDFTISANTCPASGATLAGGASCSISVTFGPKSTGVKKGTILINDGDPSSPQLVGLNGTGSSNVSLSSTFVAFPMTPVGLVSSSTKITLTNNTGISLTLGNPVLVVTGPFTVASGTTCTNGLVVAVKGTCVISVAFKPTVTGYAGGNLSIADSDITSPQTVTLRGTGTGIKFTPASFAFPTTTRGAIASTTVTITNVGTTSVYFTGAEISGPNSADFGANYANQPPCGNTASNPLLPGGICKITVTFGPSIVGSESAVYKVFDNSIGSPQSFSMSGKGQ